MPHIHEKYDFVVTVYIVFESKVLLVNHPRYNMWIPMGGHIELDEDPEEALFREIKEETDLEVEILSEKPEVKGSTTKFIYPPSYIDVHMANSPHKHIALVYFARAKNGKFVLSGEHTDMRWLSSSELEDPSYKLSEEVKFYARRAIAQSTRQ
ncbi:MAG TPA: NUDIX domain-containing protein [Candidatus Saccharimonadales bacterium]|nr:NUDIX domain-containing protein [Candidatus Saccharimonadales bacterium]